MEVSIAQKKNQKRKGKIKEYRFIYLLLILPVLYILIFR